MKLLRSPLPAVLGALLVATLASGGQISATLSGPVLGYLWNSGDGKLRPVQGILGNASIGDPVELGFAISQVLALDSRHFLVSTDASPGLVLIDMVPTSPSVIPVANAPAKPFQVAGSRNGSAAALYYTENRSVLIVTGLLTTPRVVHGLDVSFADGPLTRMAISDDGDSLVYSISEANEDVLYGWTSTSGHHRLATAGSVAAIALAASGDAVVADSKKNEVFAIRDPRGSAIRQLLADDRAGVSNPRGVAVSSGNQVYVANAGSGAILALDFNGILLRTQSCNCEPSGFSTLRDSVFMLTNQIDRTIFLLDAGPAGDRVYFVPPLRTND